MPSLKRPAKPSSDRILVAAEALFASKGYADVSLRQLIAAAGVSTTAFYARFPSKAAVLEKLTETLFAELHVEAAAVLRQARNLDEGIKRGIDLVVDHFGPRKALVRLIISEAGSVPSVLLKRRQSYLMLAMFLARYLRALDERRVITCKDPETVAWALVGALEMQFVRWAVWGDLPDAQLTAALRMSAHAILPKEHS
jgi:AcrR family transcriptional regulator